MDKTRRRVLHYRLSGAVWQRATARARQHGLSLASWVAYLVAEDTRTHRVRNRTKEEQDG